jgi:tRNA(Ile)-lysidine synthase
MEPHAFELAVAADWPPSGWQDVGVVAAVSGGADSVAMVHALARLKTGGRGGLAVAHFNHRLRADACRDAEFVAALASRLGLPCELGHADTRAAARLEGDGLEAAARSERYQFLQAAAERIGARYVVTAHTADDQAETILHRIIRGTGVAGLAGMRRVRPLGDAVTLMRPLLATSRADVLAYLTHLGQPHCEDPSNLSPAHTRNRIRHALLPLLQSEYNPAVMPALLRLGATAADLQRIVDQLVAQWIERAVKFPRTDLVTLDCGLLAGANRHLVRELFVAIWRRQSWPEQSMGFSQWDRLAEMALAAPTCRSNSESGPPQKQTFPGPVSAERTAAMLSLEFGRTYDDGR